MKDSLIKSQHEYEDKNKYIREKLKFFITKNTKYNLRELSRALNKNDAYLQQYFHLLLLNFLMTPLSSIISLLTFEDIILFSISYIKNSVSTPEFNFLLMLAI